MKTKALLSTIAILGTFATPTLASELATTSSSLPPSSGSSSSSPKLSIASPKTTNTNRNNVESTNRNNVDNTNKNRNNVESTNRNNVESTNRNNINNSSDNRNNNKNTNSADNSNTNNNKNAQGQLQGQGQGQLQGQGQGQGQLQGQGQGQDQGQDQGQGQAQRASSSQSQNSANNGNTQGTFVDASNRSTNTYVEIPEAAVAPLPAGNAGVGGIGDIIVPLPGFQVGTFYSNDDNAGFARGTSRNAVGVTAGFSVPLGAGQFREAANNEIARRAASQKVQLIKEAIWLEKNGIEVTSKDFPQHFQALGKAEISETLGD